MEELKMYAIYRYENAYYIDYPEEELVKIVMATESEMKELVEKASYENAPYGNSCCIYSYEETTIPRYDRNDPEFDMGFPERAKHCSDCQHLINGKCEIWTGTNHDQSNFVANDCKNFKRR